MSCAGRLLSLHFAAVAPRGSRAVLVAVDPEGVVLACSGCSALLASAHLRQRDYESDSSDSVDCAGLRGTSLAQLVDFDEGALGLLRSVSGTLRRSGASVLLRCLDDRDEWLIVEISPKYDQQPLDVCLDQFGLYEKKEIVGVGRFGIVRRAEHRLTRFPVAIKTVPIKSIAVRKIGGDLKSSLIRFFFFFPCRTQLTRSWKP